MNWIEVELKVYLLVLECLEVECTSPTWRLDKLDLQYLNFQIRRAVPASRTKIDLQQQPKPFSYHLLKFAATCFTSFWDIVTALTAAPFHFHLTHLPPSPNHQNLTTLNTKPRKPLTAILSIQPHSPLILSSPHLRKTRDLFRMTSPLYLVSHPLSPCTRAASRILRHSPRVLCSKNSLTSSSIPNSSFCGQVKGRRHNCG